MGCVGAAAGWVAAGWVATGAADGWVATGAAAGAGWVATGVADGALAGSLSRAKIFGSLDFEGEAATGLELGLAFPATATARPEAGAVVEGEAATVGGGSAGFVAGGMMTTWAGSAGAPGWAAACSRASAIRLTAVERPAVAGGAPEIEMFGSVPVGTTSGTPESWAFPLGNFFCSIASSDRCTYSENSLSGAVFSVVVGVKPVVVAATGKRTQPDRLASHNPKTNRREPNAAPSNILSKDCLD